ncbi:MAG: SDR family oxidoreductase [Halioglobus sp.]|jgi:NAD(P)-dependent dehydrogenase (short-subunit alcohol dehydrogenase family)|nr:SDR family oxidoreductase [Halioglobus sp.]
MPMNYPGKAQRVLVTAGGSGIGRAAAERFSSAGADVYICDISDKALQETLRELPGVRGSLADVGDSRQVEALCRDAQSTMGGIDVLLNNAGISGPRAAVEDIEYEDWNQTLRINLSGMFHCIKQVVPHMKAQGGGAIINIVTASVKTGLPNRLPYIASKSAVLGMSHTLARELGPHNIRCNCILPGLIDNERGRALIAAYASENSLSPETARQEFLRYVSMRTFIQPEEIGDMAVFLASDAARHVTGQEIAVDGNAEWEV